jgi:hypothetical protein
MLASLSGSSSVHWIWSVSPAFSNCPGSSSVSSIVGTARAVVVASAVAGFSSCSPTQSVATQ